MEEFEMECDSISEESRPCDIIPQQVVSNDETMEFVGSNPDIGILPLQRPSTPPNTRSFLDNEIFTTPSSNDSSFIKRVGIDKLMKSRIIPRMTSTPVHDVKKLSDSLPPTHTAPNLSLFKDVRQCKSADTWKIRKPKLGPQGNPLKYINPFTPDGKLLASKVKAQKKFKRLSLDASLPKFRYDSSESETQSSSNQSGSTFNLADFDLDDIPRCPRLREFNVNRFNEEFIQLKEIGKGEHGCVYKCLNRLNGCFYAIKKTLKPIKTGLQERSVRNEIYAHGVLSHTNIVRNYSCWKEDGFVFIQNEFCNGGNLETYIETKSLSETMLRNLLYQIASALKFMHNIGLAHMDIKPGNIFLCIIENKDSSLESDGGFSDEEKEEIVFKLGDLGHVSKLDENDAEEGDCRYLSREIIEEKYTHMDRADIFALGLTVYEAAGGGPLPKNGDEWHEIRNGNLKYLSAYSKEFNDILKKLTDPSAEKRPKAAEVVEMIKPSSPLPTDVSTYIQQFRRTNTRLEHTALATNQYLKVLFKSHRQIQEQLQSAPSTSSGSKKKGAVSNKRVVGLKTKRSSSTTTF